MAMIDIKKRKKSLESVPSYRLVPPFPKEIFIDLTAHCNQRCVFCSNRKARNKKTMPLDLAKKMLAEAYAQGTREVGVYATGESFLLKNLASYVRCARQIGYTYIFITTNGVLATPERVKPVLDAGLNSIKFSISAGTRRSYRMIHGTDSFHTVLRNLAWVHRYRTRSGLAYRIYVTMVYTDATRDEVPILKKKVAPFIDRWDPHQLNNQCGNLYENNSLGDIKQFSVRGRVSAAVCFQPFKGFTITPEGYLSACVLDYQKMLIVADLNKTDMKQARHSRTYRLFRKRHRERDLEGLICYNCLHNTQRPVRPLRAGFERPFDTP